ncbi:MAG: mannitol dehydrogenase family protein [Defluviitaleaceae bacterium]|nr:mannitol dehydrogenase family protein [Defluviitaleaceae bacterium]
MRLDFEDIKNKEKWEQKGFILPKFNIEEITKNTKEEPTWLHFGAGNIFRAFPALCLQKLLNSGKYNKGIIVCESYDEEIIEKSFLPYDNLSTVVTIFADGNKELEILASISESLNMSSGKDRLIEIFIKNSLQIVSLTITEKGYQTHDINGNILPYIQKEISDLPQNAKSIPALLTYLLIKRYEKNKMPIALVSMDNCSYNGDLLKKSVLTIANEWLKKEYVNEDFLKYISENVSYPITMIDKITPMPSNIIADYLKNLGYEDTEITKTDKNSTVASFVNAEETGYLVIEDLFPNGRPPLEEAGIIFTDRETVINVEKMKVGACLNPLHTIIAIFGCLLGYKSVSEAMKDEALVELIKSVGYNVLLPFVPDPEVISPKDFINEVIEKRFPNPFIPDTPQRIATDTSQKIPVRFGETLKTREKYCYTDDGFEFWEVPDMNLSDLSFFIAGWFRYLVQIDDKGEPMELSPDPLLDTLIPIFKDYKLGEENIFNRKTIELLKNKAIFGIDLSSTYDGEEEWDDNIGGYSGIVGYVQEYFTLMTKGLYAVRYALDELYTDGF